MVCWIAARLAAARRALVIARASDDLEVARELPIRDVLAELALFPFPCRREMVDEGFTEQSAGHLGLLQPLSRFPQRPGQVELRRRRHRISVPRHRRVRRDALLDSPQAAA